MLPFMLCREKHLRSQRMHQVSFSCLELLRPGIPPVLWAACCPSTWLTPSLQSMEGLDQSTYTTNMHNNGWCTITGTDSGKYADHLEGGLDGDLKEQPEKDSEKERKRPAWDQSDHQYYSYQSYQQSHLDPYFSYYQQTPAEPTAVLQIQVGTHKISFVIPSTSAISSAQQSWGIWTGVCMDIRVKFGAFCGLIIKAFIALETVCLCIS